MKWKQNWITCGVVLFSVMIDSTHFYHWNLNTENKCSSRHFQTSPDLCFCICCLKVCWVFMVTMYSGEKKTILKFIKKIHCSLTCSVEQSFKPPLSEKITFFLLHCSSKKMVYFLPFLGPHLKAMKANVKMSIDFSGFWIFTLCVFANCPNC